MRRWLALVVSALFPAKIEADSLPDFERDRFLAVAEAGPVMTQI